MAAKKSGRSKNKGKTGKAGKRVYGKGLSPKEPEDELEDEEERPRKKSDVDELFSDEDDHESKKKKKKRRDELDEIFDMGNDSEEDIYATEEFERYDDGIAD